MTVRETLIDLVEDVIAVAEPSISPSLPVLYIDEVGTEQRKYGMVTTVRLSMGATSKDNLATLYDDVYAAIGTSVTTTAAHFERIAWNTEQPYRMLDGNWGRRATLKVYHWEG